MRLPCFSGKGNSFRKQFPEPIKSVLYFRQTWTDERLSFSGTVDKVYNIHSSWVENLWRPDTTFPKVKSANRHDVATENLALDIKSNGEVTVSERITARLNCDFSFNWFPFDSQLCEFDLESMAYRSKQLILKWKTDQTLDNPYGVAVQESGQYYFTK